MEITYDIIIKYLAPNNKDTINEIPIVESLDDSKDIKNNNDKLTQIEYTNQKHIFTYSKKFPDIFKKFLGDNFYKYGISIYDSEKNNISFWASLLTLLDKKFITPIDNDEITIIKNIKNQLLENYSKLSLSNILKKFEKNDFKERMRLEPDYYILQYVVDILDINFIIFDFDKLELYTLYKDDKLNPWKQTLLFAKYKNFWEPIMTNKSKGNIKRFFDINDVYIKKIFLSNTLKYYEDNKEYIIQTNILDIIIHEKKELTKEHKIIVDITDNKISESEIDDELIINSNESIFIKEDINDKYKDLNKTKLTKMKVIELLKISDELNLKLNKKTKKDIIITNILSKILTL
jgi:hypothetical protein